MPSLLRRREDRCDPDHNQSMTLRAWIKNDDGPSTFGVPPRDVTDE
jgi:hypothetical protein